LKRSPEVYELFDKGTRNLVRTFDSEEEAVDFVASRISSSRLTDLILGVEDSDGRYRVVAKGDELRRRALRLSGARVHFAPPPNGPLELLLIDEWMGTTQSEPQRVVTVGDQLRFAHGTIGHGFSVGDSSINRLEYLGRPSSAMPIFGRATVPVPTSTLGHNPVRELAS
jgi:hypothetical protein